MIMIHPGLGNEKHLRPSLVKPKRELLVFDRCGLIGRIVTSRRQKYFPAKSSAIGVDEIDGWESRHALVLRLIFSLDEPGRDRLLAAGVGSFDPRNRRVRKGFQHSLNPVPGRGAVRIRKENDRGEGFLDPPVPRHRRSLRGLTDQAHVRTPSHLTGSIRRTVVHNDDFIIAPGNALFRQGPKAPG